MTKKTQLIQSLVFLVFIALFFALNLLLPDKSFSQQENRSLQTAPKFTFSDLFSGKFTDKFETYVTDQFAFRDHWITLKARTEQLSGKQSNNGVYLCGDDSLLLEPYETPDQSKLDLNLSAIDRLAGSSNVPVYFALIPSGSEIWRDQIPAGAPNASQKETIDYAYSKVGAKTVDMYAALEAHSGEYIYYRTDHHWTTTGAYYGYEALGTAMGFDPIPLEQLPPSKVVTNDFYGTTWSTSGYTWVDPDSIWTYVQDDGSLEITNYPKGQPEPGSLYVDSYLDVKDKYSYFYGGNTPLLTIETGLKDASSLLILRDSYMDSLSPFLTAHFSKLHILDLRYYRASIAQYIEENNIDNILVCYSVKNFVSDDNVFLAAR